MGAGYIVDDPQCPFDPHARLHIAPPLPCINFAHSFQPIVRPMPKRRGSEPPDNASSQYRFQRPVVSSLGRIRLHMLYIMYIMLRRHAPPLRPGGLSAPPPACGG